MKKLDKLRSAGETLTPDSLFEDAIVRELHLLRRQFDLRNAVSILIEVNQVEMPPLDSDRTSVFLDNPIYHTEAESEADGVSNFDFSFLWHLESS
jgi:hypothetical protein